MTTLLAPAGTWHVEMAGVAAMVPLARLWVKDLLGDSPATDKAELALAELATNSLRHSSSGEGGKVHLEVTVETGMVRVTVIDEGPRRSPADGWMAEDADCFGHGLEIVAAITSGYGHDRLPGGRRRSWAEVTP